ncbi:MAG: DUF5103 domain-containing protein [Prevotellaceae bacterium]|jgi:hypothetical protein|nr:DUF5103 domain-containing protein [Prevotellaceae bacterium]
MRRTIALALLTTALCGMLRAQDTELFTPHIRTVRLLVNNDYTLPAAIRLASNEVVEVSFDHLSHEYHRFHYRLTHCHADGTPSDLSPTEYMDGFDDHPIEEYAVSVNTTLPYTHYRLQIPNEQMRLRLSGNYRLTVYDEDDNDNPAFTTYIRVVEPQVTIAAQVSSDTDIDRNRSHQQVSFTINHPAYPIRHPESELYVQVYQNNRTDNKVTQLKPTYIGNNRLSYEHIPALIFDAGNEYRRFETVSLRHPTRGVEKIQYIQPYYHATLRTDLPRTQNYSYDQDRNGRYLIRSVEAEENSDTEADYLLTHFTLLCDPPLAQGELHLQGNFTDGFTDENRLTYNNQTHAYEGTLLLKQGAYNYQYLSTTGGTLPIEGNFFETENEYLILVYHRTFGERYDRLIGMQRVTTAIDRLQ